MANQIKLKTGSKATRGGFGLRGMSRGMYSGGFTLWVYGIKGLIALEILECWGDFKNMKI